MVIRSIALFAALALAGACKSDDGGASNTPQQPTASPTPAPAPGGDQLGPPGVVIGGSREQMTPEQRRAERMKEFDKNGDGRLDREERQAMRQANLERRMQRMDADRDGKISRDEASRRMGQRVLADFDHADANHDSFISREELQSAMQEFQAQRRAERQQNGGPGVQPAPAPGAQNPDDDLPDDQE